jgi:hypothetical protein
MTSDAQQRIMRIFNYQREEDSRVGSYTSPGPNMFKHLSSMYDMGRAHKPGSGSKSAVEEKVRVRVEERDKGKGAAKEKEPRAKGSYSGTKNYAEERGSPSKEVKSAQPQVDKKKIVKAVTIFSEEVQKIRDKISAKRNNAVKTFVSEFEAVQKRLTTESKEKSQRQAQKGAQAVKVFCDEFQKVQKSLESKLGAKSKKAVDVFASEINSLKSKLEREKEQKAEKDKMSLQKAATSGKRAALKFEEELMKTMKQLESKTQEEKKKKEEQERASLKEKQDKERADLKERLEKEKNENEKKAKKASEAVKAFEKELGLIRKELEEKDKKEKAEKLENEKKKQKRLASMSTAAGSMEKEIMAVKKRLEDEKKKKDEAEKLEKQKEKQREEEELKKKGEMIKEKGKAGALAFESFLNEAKSKLEKAKKKGEAGAREFMEQFENAKKKEEARIKEEQKRKEEEERKISEAAAMEAQKQKPGKDEEDYDADFDEEDIPEEEDFEEIGESGGDSPPKGFSPKKDIPSLGKKETAKPVEVAIVEQEESKRTKSRLLDAVRNSRNVAKPEPFQEEQEVFDNAIEDSWGPDPFDSSHEPKPGQGIATGNKGAQSKKEEEIKEETKPKKNPPGAGKGPEKEGGSSEPSGVATPSRAGMHQKVIGEDEIQKINLMFNEMQLFVRFPMVNEL